MQQLLNYSKSLGFKSCALVQTNQIPFDFTLIKYCQENLCGRYGSNYSCPPHCGAPQQMKQKLLQYNSTVVVQSVFEGVNFDDKQTVQNAKNLHNQRLQQLLDFARASGKAAMIVGATGCEKCSPCLVEQGLPCKYPEQMFSCTSAYCIDVAQLANLCDLSYSWENGKLFLYGLLIFS